MANNKKATVIWFTGLSGSGKTTISKALNDQLLLFGKSVYIFDGDNVRKSLNKNLGFSREDIRENNRLIASWVKLEANRYDFILVPIISPYAEDRLMAKEIVKHNFIEFFIKTPLSECIARDPKGLYAKALNGEIQNLIGVSKSNPYEKPEKADLEIDTTVSGINRIINRIINFLIQAEYLESDIIKEDIKIDQ
tara:strand:+ start:1679 stop:2260 length:582 start_codon:yes stop_codon:yes gene_type:complete